MNHINTLLRLRRLLTGCVTVALILGALPQVAEASSWSPTLLVNTEAFQVIDDGDGSTNIELRFGDSANEILRWDVTNSRFQFTDDIHVEGNITGSGTLTVDGAATLGSTLNIGGVTYTFPGADGTSSGKVLATNSSGQLSWTSKTTDTDTTYDAGQGLTLTSTTFSVNSTLTGTLVDFATVSGGILHARDQLRSSGTLLVDGAATIGGTSTLQAVTATTIDTTGNITTDANLTINEDNGGANAVLTFGNDAGVETITFSDSNNRFEVSDDIYTADTLTVDGAATLGSTLNIGGVTYTFPGADGSASGKVLATDGSGQLSWTDAASSVSSGNTIFLSPGYPFAVYFASGSSAIGQLYASGGNLTNLENNYTWTSTKSGIQDYWISTRVKIPHDFSTWAATPIQFRYKTGTSTASQNHVTVKFFDTAGTEIALTGGGGLTSTTWATAGITGPQGTGTYTPDSYITVMVKLASSSTASAQANAGYINLNWRTVTP